MTDALITAMLSELGITDAAAQQSALDALVAAGVVSGRPNRTRIAEDKRERVGAVLGDAFLRHCRNGDCSRQAASDAGSREALLVEQQFCEVCGGSTNRRALERMAGAMQAAGTSRVLVVGGTKEMEREIRNNTPALVEWRFENGLTSRDDRYYRADMQWAELIVIWSSTPLPHKVSRHFGGKGDSRRMTVTRRGVAALADQLRQRLER